MQVMLQEKAAGEVAMGGGEVKLMRGKRYKGITA